MWISQSAFDQATDEMSSESTNDASQCDSCNQRLAEDRFSFVFCFCFFFGGGRGGGGGIRPRRRARSRDVRSATRRYHRRVRG